MATINRKPINQKQPRRSIANDNACGKYYNSKAWWRLRDVYKTEHPLCQCCLENHRVEPMTDIHHRTPFMNGVTEEERWDLFLRESNLVPLCKCCHLAVHKKITEYHLEGCDSLTNKEWREAHGFEE